MSVDEKREKVLEAIYEEMLHKSNFHYDKDLVETVKAIEAARIAEKEFKLKDDLALVENANKEIDRNLEERLKEEELKLKEKELKLKDDIAVADNANKQQDRELEKKLRRRELITNAVIAGVSTILTLGVFAFELHATRKFEETGTETSAANRWLKNSFPKVKAL